VVVMCFFCFAFQWSLVTVENLVCVFFFCQFDTLNILNSDIVVLVPVETKILG